MPATEAHKRYERLAGDRFFYLQQAEQSARLTIPSLFPHAGDRSKRRPAHLRDPWQGLGARGVNNLASKLLLSMLPTRTTFFRYRLEESLLQQLKAAGDDGVNEELSQAERALVERERAIVREVERQSIRPQAFEAMKHLLVAGNILIYFLPQGGIKLFHLDRYVVKRGAAGEVLEIVIQEDVPEETLPERLKKLMPDMAEGDTSRRDEELKLYTHIVRRREKFEWYQEFAGQEVPDSRGFAPVEKSPWLPLRFTTVAGEDYGRGFVEEYRGDLRALETLSKAIQQASAAAAKVIFLVRPNSGTNPRKLERLPNASFTQGSANDITALQLDKAADMQVAQAVQNELRRDLSFAFLLNSAVRRDAERVTAEEIREIAEELEETLGGVFSVLSQEFQLPLVRRLEIQLEKRGKLPAIDDNLIEPVIVTGLDAIGRGHDLQRQRAFLQDMQLIAAIDPGAPDYVRTSELIDRAVTGNGIERDNLILSEEQVRQSRQTQQLQALIQQIGPDAAKTAIQQFMQQQGSSTQA